MRPCGLRVAIADWTTPSWAPSQVFFFLLPGHMTTYLYESTQPKCRDVPAERQRSKSPPKYLPTRYSSTPQPPVSCLWRAFCRFRLFSASPTLVRSFPGVEEKKRKEKKKLGANGEEEKKNWPLEGCNHQMHLPNASQASSRLPRHHVLDTP